MDNDKINKNQDMAWFVLKTIFSSEMKVKVLLDERGIENFIPMCYKIKVVKHKKEKKLLPAINDLIFVHSTKKEIEDFKADILLNYNYSTYFLTRKEGTKRKIEIVPNKQMEEFIKVASHYDDDIVYFAPEEIELKKGTKVRIVGGIFDGVEGTLLRVKGKKHKRIVLQIPGLSVATSYVTPDLIEIIKD